MAYSEHDAISSVTGEPGGIQLKRPSPARRKNNYLLHIGLFLLTYLSCTYSGLQFVSNVEITSFSVLLSNLPHGFLFGTLVMLFLSAHEFGHYFAARAHGVDTTLPFYIPMPFINPFGTMGAVIRMRTGAPSRRVIFDIGVAGPLAGFVVALAYLVIGMVTMPGKESLYAFHPEFKMLTTFPDYGLTFGGFLLFSILKSILIAPGRFFPGMNQIYHYPFLAVGWFGMFVTALNLIPVGQLDGGHIIYGMFGRRQVAISRWFMRFLIFAGCGTLGAFLLEATRGHDTGAIYNFLRTYAGPPMEWVAHHAAWWLRGWMGWLLWYAIIRIFVKVPHPPAYDDTPLDRKRMVIGWIALIILLLTFTFTGIYEIIAS